MKTYQLTILDITALDTDNMRLMRRLADILQKPFPVDLRAIRRADRQRLPGERWLELTATQHHEINMLMLEIAKTKPPLPKPYGKRI